MVREDRSWFAVQARTGHEASVCTILNNKGIEVFLPTYTLRRRWSDRVKEVSQALFPGYLFSRFDPRFRLPVLTTPGVYTIVGIGKAPAAISELEIEAVRKVVNSRLPVHRWPFLKIGQRVRILHGPLAGVEGLLVQIKKSFRVVVSVDAVERSIAVDVSADDLGPC